MENKLILLKADFNNVVVIRNNVQNIFDILQVRINKLKLFYVEFIKNSKNNMFVFGLDSFQFQSKIIDIEYDDMKRLFGAINNRMYCEYYKLNKIIIEFILKSVDDKKYTDTLNSVDYPTYKDLEPFKEYDFNTTLDIHQNILNMLNLLTTILSTKDVELETHKTKQNIGLNINNYVSTFIFDNTVLREKILMFISYIEYFHSLHTKYLKRFSTKIQLMHTHIDTDIKFDEAVEINKETKKGLLEELNTGNIDKHLLHDLRKSISIKPYALNDETSVSETSEDEDIQVVITPTISNIGNLFNQQDDDNEIHPINNLQEQINDDNRVSFEETDNIIDNDNIDNDNVDNDNVDIDNVGEEDTSIIGEEDTSVIGDNCVDENIKKKKRANRKKKKN